ncbi:hypothetical protein M6B38_371145 [Iris pallida]|uniref:Uncharacterized protein n=1 Tax=Iris pallida TaxID=29817 RepID=A0AAX6GEF9_IRIPA|nr:hypothetical protein M6B38_371145 [Iris pallida]
MYKVLVCDFRVFDSRTIGTKLKPGSDRWQ